MAVQPDPVIQRRQAALFMSGIDCGGLGGQDGGRTDKAREIFAKRYGLDPKDKAGIDAALDSKMADPEARDRYVRIISSTPKPTKDDIITLQWCLKEDGKRDMSRSITIAGLMDGIPGTETNSVMRESRKRPTSQAELNRYLSPENVALINSGRLTSLAANFQDAIAQATVAAPVSSPQERSTSMPVRSPTASA